MFFETPETLIYVTLGAFVLGWIAGKIGAYFGSKSRTDKRDPRDDRIRSLEAEHRVAQVHAGKARDELENVQKELEEAKKTIEDRESAVAEHLQTIARLKKDLKDSVKKTRELRNELSDRATENLKSEVKLREVETELSVAQASSEMITTGVLDYSMAPPKEEDDEDESGVVKAAT